MFRFNVILLTTCFVVLCSSRSLEHGQLIDRIKRSPHYWNPPLPPNEPYWAPPHGPHWPQPQPFWHHQHHQSDFPDPSYQEYKAQVPPFQQYKDNQAPTFQQYKSDQIGPSVQQYNVDHPKPPFQQYKGDQPGGFQQYGNEPSNVPCETCKGKNAAVSNSESVNGDAIAISISRSNKNN